MAGRTRPAQPERGLTIRQAFSGFRANAKSLAPPTLKVLADPDETAPACADWTDGGRQNRVGFALGGGASRGDRFVRLPAFLPRHGHWHGETDCGGAGARAAPFDRCVCGHRTHGYYGVR